MQGPARPPARCGLRVRRDDGALRGVRQILRAKGLSEGGASADLVARLVDARGAAEALYLETKARAADKSAAPVPID